VRLIGTDRPVSNLPLQAANNPSGTIMKQMVKVGLVVIPVLPR